MEHLVLATYPIVNTCNISCPWCAAQLSSQPIFSTEWVLGALSRIPHPVHGVALTGGEPFTSPKILETKKTLEANDYRVFAITNGTLHDQVFEFTNGGTLDIALSIHNPAIFPEWITAKKQELLDECRRRGLKIMAGLFSVDSAEDIEAAVKYILENQDVFQTVTISTVYRRDVPAMSMDDLMSAVASRLPAAYCGCRSAGKAVITTEPDGGFPIVIRRSPTREEYEAEPGYKVPGCLFMCCTGEFLPVAEAQYVNEERLA